MDLTIVYVIIVIIIIILTIMYLKCIFYEPMFINKKLYCHNPSKSGNTTIQHKNFAKPFQGTNFSFNFWIYLENVTENACRDSELDSYVTIFTMIDKDDIAQFTLNINQYNSNLQLILSKSKKNLSEDLSYDIIDSLPNQKWINLSINIENKYIDVFVDGKLYNAFYSPNIIKFLPNTNMNIICSNKGFYGYISKFRYFNSFINYKRVNTLYKNNHRESGDYDLLWWIK